jgi:hypothetical protein
MSRTLVQDRTLAFNTSGPFNPKSPVRHCAARSSRAGCGPALGINEIALGLAPA